MAAGYQGPPEVLACFEAMVALVPAVDRKGATMPFTSGNGHLFSFLDPSGMIALRFSPTGRATFVARHGEQTVVQHGRVMADYVALPERVLDDSAELREWFEHAWGSVGSLAPKPTTRPAKKAKR